MIYGEQGRTTCGEQGRTILLTDEQIRACQGRSRTCDDNSMSICRAQLKAVIGYLDSLEFYDDFGGDSGKAAIDVVRQAILKEVDGDCG